MANEKKSVSSWFSGVKTEFGKIIWPNKERIVRETTATVVVSVVVALIIVVVDMVVKYGVDFIVNL